VSHCVDYYTSAARSGAVAELFFIATLSILHAEQIENNTVSALLLGDFIKLFSVVVLIGCCRVRSEWRRSNTIECTC